MNTFQNIQSKKIELIQWLSSIEDISLINKILEFKENESIDWWQNISEEEKKSINQGIIDADSGLLSPHSDVRKRYEKWL